MTTLRFSTFLTTGHDRGTIYPLYIYEASVPVGEDDAKWLDRVAAGWKTALEQVSDELPDEWDFFLDEITTLDEYIQKDSDLDQLIHDNRHLSDDARPIMFSEVDAVHQMVTDTLLSRDVADALVHVQVDIDWDLAWDTVDAPMPTPVKVPVGTVVYTRNGTSEAIYDGYNPEFRLEVGHVLGPENNLVPVEFVNSRRYRVEAFPLPPSVKRRNGKGWWARSKDHPKVEALGRTKKEAVALLTVNLAHAEFWS